MDWRSRGGVDFVLVLVIVRPGQEPLPAGPMADDPEHFRPLELGRIQPGLAALK